MEKFLIRTVPSGFKFDLRAANGQVIASSEVYTSQAACRKGIASIRRSAPLAGTEDTTRPDYQVLPRPKFQLYRDKSGAYRFRLLARNGKIIAASDGYATRLNCLDGIEWVRAAAAVPPSNGEPSSGQVSQP